MLINCQGDRTIFNHRTQAASSGPCQTLVREHSAGALAALTAGAAYYGFNYGACCAPSWEAKLFRLLAASVPMGGVLGALMGWLRPSGPAHSEPGATAQPAADFLSFIIGIFLLLVLCVSFFYIFDKMRTLVGDADGPQGLIRFWHIALLLTGFAIFYVFMIVYLYDRADETGTEPERRVKALSSACAALICAFTLFGAASLALGGADFQPRAQATVCAAPSAAGTCQECLAGEICAGDPREPNFISGILVRTMILVVLLLLTYLAATHPRSPLLRAIDRSPWLRAAHP